MSSSVDKDMVFTTIDVQEAHNLALRFIHQLVFIENIIFVLNLIKQSYEKQII